MFWASERVTTRVEDIAHCLMGLFGVNMPLLYGEGERAFIRLQEEVIDISGDLLPVRLERDELFRQSGRFRGLLAKSPADFVRARTLSPLSTMRIGIRFSPLIGVSVWTWS